MSTTTHTETSVLRIKDIIFHETVRMTLYKHFSECFQLPGPELSASLSRMDELLGILGGDIGPVTGMIGHMNKPDGRSTMLVDFSRLFLGPYQVKAPPYGSVYLEPDRRVMGDSTLDAVKHYEAAGLSMNSRFYDVPDHISAELEFMYFLIFQEIGALRKGLTHEAGMWLDRQGSFLQTHIGAWVPDFTSRVESHAETDFYHNLAKACNGFLSKEVSDLCIQASKLK